MLCVKCGERTHIYDSRIDDRRGIFGWVNRRRECLECGHRFKTTEMPVEDLAPMEAAHQQTKEQSNDD